MTSLQGRAADGSWLERMFDQWWHALPDEEVVRDRIIRVDEFRDGDAEVIRAEMPDIDPEKDVAVTVHDGVLRIAAQRRADRSLREEEEQT